MKIGFDAKRIYDNTTGLGSYGRSLMHNLIRWYPQYDYNLFVHQNFFRNSSFKYQEFVEKTIVSDHYLPPLWRSTEIVKDIVQSDVEIYHGLSNELPFALPDNIKSVVTIHDVIFQKFPEDFSLLDRTIFKYKTNRACEEADAIIAVSNNTKHDLIEDFKVPEDKIFVIPPTWGREYEYEYTNWFKVLLRQKYNLPYDFILYVGSLSSRKNLKVIVDALEYPENSEFHLVVVSNDSGNYEEIESYIMGKEVKHRMHFLKTVPWYELPGIYCMAKCVVYPSFYEGFGLPIIESIKMDVPVISADNSSLREAGGTGAVYVGTTDIEAWVDAINRMMVDTEFAKNIVVQGKSYINRFVPEVVTSSIVDLYTWLHEN
ncbi:MAG TPA: glycosyltransferase family 1 protein [Chitinophagales bacterium]|nr:glycosyltransferase family 1 protein [Chitinophagales bacterium]